MHAHSPQPHDATNTTQHTHTSRRNPIPIRGKRWKHTSATAEHSGKRPARKENAPHRPLMIPFRLRNYANPYFNCAISHLDWNANQRRRRFSLPGSKAQKSRHFLSPARNPKRDDDTEKTAQLESRCVLTGVLASTSAGAVGDSAVLESDILSSVFRTGYFDNIPYSMQYFGSALCTGSK